MSLTNQNSVDDILAQVQADTSAVKAAVNDPAVDAALAAQAVQAVDDAVARVDEIAGEMEPPAVPPAAAPATPPPVHGSFDTAPSASAIVPPGADLRRLLAIEVPVIVQLGMRRLTVNEVMRLAVGAIVEFGKSAEEELDLLINNKPVGKGHAVKVGENFGIKITTIDPVKETIRKLGS